MAYTETDWPQIIRADSNLLRKLRISEAALPNASAIRFLPRSVLGLGGNTCLGIMIDSIEYR